MCGYKIKTAPNIAVVVVKNIARTGNAAGQFRRLILVAFPKTADHVAEAVVPFTPARRKRAQLITAVAHVPRFGNQFDIFQNRILTDGVQKSAFGGKTAFSPAERGRQIKAEAVDMHFFRPVTQGIRNQLKHIRVFGIERSAAAGAVVIIALVFRIEHVIGGVVNPPVTERRPHLVAFRGMVVDHVQNHFQPVLMIELHHFFELVQIVAGQIRLFRRKKAAALVAPVIVAGKALFVPVAEKGVHRQQLHRGDPQIFQIRHHRRRAKAEKGAAVPVGNLRVQFGITANMRFV